MHVECAGWELGMCHSFLLLFFFVSFFFAFAFVFLPELDLSYVSIIKYLEHNY